MPDEEAKEVVSAVKTWTVPTDRCGRKKHSGEIIPGVVIVPRQRRESVLRRAPEEALKRTKILCDKIEIPLLWKMRMMGISQILNLITDLLFLASGFVPPYTAHTTDGVLLMWVFMGVAITIRYKVIRIIYWPWMFANDDDDASGPTNVDPVGFFPWLNCLLRWVNLLSLPADVFSMAAALISYHEMGDSWQNRLSFFYSTVTVLYSLKNNYRCEDIGVTLDFRRKHRRPAYPPAIERLNRAMVRLAVNVDCTGLDCYKDCAEWLCFAPIFCILVVGLVIMMVLVFLPPMNLQKVNITSPAPSPAPQASANYYIKATCDSSNPLLSLITYGIYNDSNCATFSSGSSTITMDNDVCSFNLVKITCQTDNKIRYKQYTSGQQNCPTEADISLELTDGTCHSLTDIAAASSLQMGLVTIFAVAASIYALM